MRDFWLKLRGRSYKLRQGETTIGRSPYCSIIVDSKLASRHHAAIRVSAGQVEVVDLGSRNGTVVNGKRIERAQPLGVGDSIRIGDEVLILSGEAGSRGSAEQTADLELPRVPQTATEAPRGGETWEESTVSEIQDPKRPEAPPGERPR